jgi:hypothetical protein
VFDPPVENFYWKICVCGVTTGDILGAKIRQIIYQKLLMYESGIDTCEAVQDPTVIISDKNRASRNVTATA